MAKLLPDHYFCMEKLLLKLIIYLLLTFGALFYEEYIFSKRGLYQPIFLLNMRTHTTKTKSNEYLPVAEDQLWACQAAGPLADLVSKSKALGDREKSLDGEDVRPLLHLLVKNTTLSLPQDAIHSAWYTHIHNQRAEHIRLI